MIIHLLSSEPNNSIEFIKFFTNEKIKNAKELLEEDIKKNKFIFFYKL